MYNQQVTLDNDVSLYDNLKRLNRLVYCLDLIPHKIEDKNSKLYNQYYFMCFDKDIQFHIENLWNYTKRINFSFDNYNENVKLNPEMFDCVIKEGKIKNSDHSLTKQNLDKKNKYVIKLLTTKKDYKNEVEKEINKNYK